MKRALSMLTTIVLFQSTIIPKEIQITAKDMVNQEAVHIESYPIPGSHLLRDKEQRLIDFFEQHPEINRLAKTRSVEWEFTVGSTHEWWADYFEAQDSGEEQYLVPSTCRAVGTNCYVFVDDAMWATDRVDQAAVDAIVEAFDNSTPADAPNNDGIFNVDTRTFGAPPDVDSDSKIIILILDIVDGWSEGGYVAGYFYSLNEHQDGGTDGARSNEAEIFYMDCDPAILTTNGGQQFALATTAHEFQHMIHWRHDVGEMIFVNEGLSEIAEHVCGYGVRNNGLYTQDTNVNLFEWDNGTRDVLADYSRAAFWSLYVYEQFGIEILKDFVINHHSSWPDFSATFNTYDANRGFFEVFEQWLIANYVNGSSAESKYTYQYSPLSKPATARSYSGDTNGEIRELVPLGAEYIKFSGGSNLAITFKGNESIIVKSLKIGSLEIEDVPLNLPYSLSGYGTTYQEVTFLVYNKSDQYSKSYSYSTAGPPPPLPSEPTILAYENGFPNNTYLPFNEGDTVAVYFDGLNGFNIDSVRIAFIQNGNIEIKINKFTNITPNSTSTPFGTSLMPLTVINSDVGTANWQNIDLRHLNLDASDDFIVGCVIGSDASVPGISVVSELPEGNDHTLFYSEGLIGARWVFPVSDSENEEYIFKYLIRAYLSDGSLAIELDPSGIVSIPAEFSLGTNYPNPFNPSTTFDFAIPKDGLVKFTVYDLLGRIIYNESRNIFAGNYSFTWEGKNQLDQQVVSGVYLLQMEAKGFTQTRKMLMIK